MNRIDRTVRRGFLLGAAALLVSACSSSGTITAATRSSAGSSAISVAVTPPPSAFPIGTFDATPTRREALAKGFSNKEIDKWYGPDGKLPMTLEFLGGSYLHFVVGDDGVKELGDKGTYSATEKLLVMTEFGEGCSGCAFTWRWSLHGKVLSLRFVSAIDSLGAADLRAVRLIVEHDYVKTG